MSLEDLCMELSRHISVVTSPKTHLHSVDARRFIAVPGKNLYFLYSIHALTLEILHQRVQNAFPFVAGTFPLSTTEVLGGPKIQSFNSFLALAAPPANCTDHIFYRTISCACGPCLTGKLLGCVNARHVPLWRSQPLRFRLKRAVLPQRNNASSIRRKLIRFRSREIKRQLPFFFCIGWSPNTQHPTVLLMSHLNVYANTVRCHVLQPHFPPTNDFGHLLSRRPYQLCSRRREQCRCDHHHAVNFSIDHILEVAVHKENGRYKNHIQRTKMQVADDSYYLVDLSDTPKNEKLYDSYAVKRLHYFNDFLTCVDPDY